VITKGGEAPNIVPEDAEVWLWVRDIEMENLLKTGERVKDIAQGAALIADVEHEVILNGGLYNSLKNKRGAEVLQSNIDLLGPIEYTKEEIEFAYKIQDAFGVARTGMSAKVLSMTEALNDPLTFASDVGDVSWNVPEISLKTITVPENISMHTWGAVACGGMSIGHKGMIYSSKALALTMIDLYMNPNLIVEIRKEFENRKGSLIYKTMLPEGPPPIPE
jgi:aminobenzoyl-glutamate utilization protein B